MNRLARYILRWLPQPERAPGKNLRITNLSPSPPDPRDQLYAVNTWLTAIDMDDQHMIDKWCPPVKQQGIIGSCGSHAITSAMELLEKKTDGEYIPLSERFHYYVVRGEDYMNTFPQDSGQYLRDGLKAASKVGIAPEKLCKYDAGLYNESPGVWAYAFGRFSRVRSYHRCFSIDTIRQSIFLELPVVLGVSVFDGIFVADPITGDFTDGGSPRGGHAVLIVGYDDKHTNPDGSLGAFYILNSWGAGWGRYGFGWVSYSYVRRHLIEAWAVTAV